MLQVFDPVLYSTKENQFLREMIGEPPIVVMRKVPSDVSVKAVQPVIEGIYELTQLAAHSGVEWVGVEKIKERIDNWLTTSAKWDQDKRPGRPRFPSMYSYDSRGRAFRSGPGSDSGFVKTKFGKDGEREPFAIELLPSNIEQWSPEWTKADAPKSGLVVDSDAKRIECLVCHHTESYNPDSRGSFNAARARMSKHLRGAKDEVARHREVHTAEFS